MESRRQKQIIYGTAFFVLLAAAALAVYFAVPKAEPTCSDNRRNQGETGVDCDGPCIACDIKALSVPTVRFEKVFNDGSRTLFAAEIENLNDRYGASDLPYALSVHGADGNVLQTIYGRTFVYAIDRRYVVEPLAADPKAISRVTFALASSSDISWASKDLFVKPNVSLRAIETSGGTGKEGWSVSGMVTNRNPFALARVEVIGFLYSAGGIPMGVSKTQTEDVASFEERNFVLNFPAEQIAVDPSKTRVFVYAIR